MPVKKKTARKPAARKKTAKRKTTAKKKAAPKRKTTARKKPAAKKKVAKKKPAAKKKVARKKPAAKKATARKKTVRKAAKKAAPKKKKAKRKPNPAFMKPMKPDTALGAVVGSKPIPRTEITKKLWAYIKRNKLQNPANRREIMADAKLKPLFGGKKKVNMFEMTKLVSKHMK
jgi:chromatin remodeling complex protein RSC6